MLRRLLVTVLFGLAAPFSRAQTAPPPDAPPNEEIHSVFSRIRGMFDFDLPAIDPPGTVRLVVHPHFGDLIHRDYLRTSVGLRWTLNTRWEFDADTLTYFHHGLRSGSSGNGIGEWEFGGKYLFDTGQQPEFQASLGLDVQLPNGAPPLDLTDGQRHFVPSLAIQHQSNSNPKLIHFGNVALDLIAPSGVPGTFSRNEPHNNSVAFTAGAIYDLGQIKWTLSGTYTTTALISGYPESFFSIRPGLIWFVPRRYTLNSKTQWIFGLEGRATVGPDGQDFSLGSRVRAEITFRQVMEKMRGAVQH